MTQPFATCFGASSANVSCTSMVWSVRFSAYVDIARNLPSGDHSSSPTHPPTNGREMTDQSYRCAMCRLYGGFVTLPHANCCPSGDHATTSGTPPRERAPALVLTRSCDTRPAAICPTLLIWALSFTIKSETIQWRSRVVSTSATVLPSGDG